MPPRWTTAQGPDGPRFSCGLTSVPAASGSWVLRTRTAMPRSTAGWIITGWSTFVPK